MKRILKEQKKKRKLVIDSLLIRLTDFELQTMNRELIDYCENLRQVIVDFNEREND